MDAVCKGSIAYRKSFGSRLSICKKVDVIFKRMTYEEIMGSGCGVCSKCKEELNKIENIKQDLKVVDSKRYSFEELINLDEKTLDVILDDIQNKIYQKEKAKQNKAFKILQMQTMLQELR